MASRRSSGFYFIFIALLGLTNVRSEQSQSGSSNEADNIHAIHAQGPKRHVYRSYQTSIYCSASSEILTPSSPQEVQNIVLSAIRSGKTVKAIGSRHSLTDVICTDGIPIDMHNINYTIANDDDTATVGGGAEMVDVLEFLHENGKSLIHVPTFGGITVAGAIGTGAHGSSLIHPPSLSDQVVGVTIIDGTGQIQKITDPEDLKAFQVHLGMLGVILDVTLKTVPLFKMSVTNYVESESILLDGTAIEWAKQYDWFEMWWFPSTKTVVVSKGVYTSNLTAPGNASTNLIPDQSPAEISSGRDAFETLQGTRNKRGMFAIQDFTQYSLYQDVVGKPAFFSEDGGKTLKNPAVGYGWQLQSNKCTNKCPWDNGNASVNPEESSMGFELSELPNIIKSMKSILGQVQASFPMIGVFIRFSRASEAYMALSSGRPTVTVEWATAMRRDPFTAARDGVGAYQGILQAMVKQHGGRPHWGKNGLHYISKDVIRSTAVNREAFIKVMKKYDPNGIFLNKFGYRLLGLSNEMDIDPQVKRCALQDYCICSKNGDCANLQSCTVVNGYNICNDIASGFLPPTFKTYNPMNITSIYEATKYTSIHSEQVYD